MLARSRFVAKRFTIRPQAYDRTGPLARGAVVSAADGVAGHGLVDHLVLHPERLLGRVEALGQPALLCSNLLGQVPILLAAGKAAPQRIEGVREAVRAAILGRSFASFHDRVSGELKPEFEPRCSPRAGFRSRFGDRCPPVRP
jgi:hypothetical protein